MIHWFIFISTLLLIFAPLSKNIPMFFRYILRLTAIMLGTTLIVSISLHIIPGDPVDHILGDQAQSSSRNFLAQELGLVDKNGNRISAIKHYSNFLQALSSNSLKSYTTRRNALDVVFERLPYTIYLALAAMLVALLLGPIFGIFASLYFHRWPDHIFTIIALLGISVPSFFLGPVLLLIFAIKLGILPISGADDGFSSIILPAFSMGTALAAMLTRMSRASMLEVLHEDYVRTAHAKGLSPRIVFFKHALRNALIPVITIIGLQFGAVLAGAVITEKIFKWPGIGLLLIEAIQKLDMPIVQTCVILIALIYALINILTDIAYTFVDPRISLSEIKK